MLLFAAAENWRFAAGATFSQSPLNCFALHF